MTATNFEKPQRTGDDTKPLNHIRASHKPDAKLDVDENLLLDMAQAILSRLNATFSPVNITSDAIEKALSEELVFTIHKIGRELSCDCSSEGHTKSPTLAVFDTLVKYFWEDKLVISLLAFAINYGEFHLLRNRQATDSLTQYVAHFKPSPDMISERESLIIILLKAVMKLSRTINKLNSLDNQKISRTKPTLYDAENQISYAVYCAIKGIVACSSQGIGVSVMGHQYSIIEARQNLTDLTEKLENIKLQLKELLDDREKEIRDWENDKAYNELKEFMKHIHNDNVEVFNNLIQTKDNEPLFNVVTNEKVSLDDLKNSPVILFISYWTISDEKIKEIVQKIGNSEGRYEIVWLPIDEELVEPNKMKKDEEINRKAKLVKRYSLHSSLTLKPHVIKYIKEDWHFEEEPLLVVLNEKGKVVRSNAYHMAMIWGSAAYPFDTEIETTLWQESKWSLEFLIEGVFTHSEKEKLEGEKLICLCGGDDLVWIANFISKAKKVIKGDGIVLELIYVGTKQVENIEGIQIKYWDELQQIRQFRVRLDSIMHSITQLRTPINKNNILNDVKMLLGAQGSGQGWTVLGQYRSENVTAVNGDIMIESLDHMIRIDVHISSVHDFFPALGDAIQEVAPKVRKHCNIITTGGIYGKDMYCVCCGGRMQKYTMYKCCVE